eukprot:GHVS01091944.1.p1 GENE.GHVS01091944.1~~GHVS01091944.1.p1  ORF type:complete len:480 (+),score=93.48 GHVS01091944.1:88-1527(+)
MSVEDRDLLTLKVMRLSQPQIDDASSGWCMLAPDELFTHRHFCTADHRQPSVNEDLGHGGLERCVDQTPALLLPSTQGYIFTGELFHAYLNLMNSSSMEALRVSVQVILQTDLHSHLLFDNSAEAVNSLGPGSCFDFSIAHRLAEQSTYELTCAVSYQLTTLSKPKSLRKSYRFNAQHPFVISHLTAHLPVHASNHGSLIEVHLENVSSSGVWLSDVCLICVEGVSAKRIQPQEESHGSTTQSRCVHRFKPKDKFSVVFALSASPPQSLVDAACLQRLPSFGYLQLQWRTAVGGEGAVCDYLVVNQHIIEAEPLELRAISCPSIVKLEQSFSVVCEVINRAEREVRPRVHALPAVLLWQGGFQLLAVEAVEEEVEEDGVEETASKWKRQQQQWRLSGDYMSVELGRLEGGATRRVNLSLMALQQGFCKLCGVYVSVDDSAALTTGSRLSSRPVDDVSATAAAAGASGHSSSSLCDILVV